MQEALTAFMEDVISHMAGYVPLKAIAERILASYASDPFGDFKVRSSEPSSGRPGDVSLAAGRVHTGLLALSCLSVSFPVGLWLGWQSDWTPLRAKLGLPEQCAPSSLNVT